MRISDWSSDVCSSDLSDIVFQALQGKAVQVDEVAGQVQLQYLPLPVIKLLVAADHAFDEKVALAERDAFANKDPAGADLLYLEIGRASCRERVCQYV